MNIRYHISIAIIDPRKRMFQIPDRIPINTVGKCNILCLPEIHPAKAISAIYHVP